VPIVEGKRVKSLRMGWHNQIVIDTVGHFSPLCSRQICGEGCWIATPFKAERDDKRRFLKASKNSAGSLSHMIPLEIRSH